MLSLVFALATVSANTEVSWKQITGALRQIETSPDHQIVCGTNSRDEIYCAPTDTYAWFQLPGNLKQVTVANGQIYGVDGDSNIRYSSSIVSGRILWNVIDGKLSQISFDGKTLCGTINGEIYCADSGLDSKPNWSRVEGSLTQVVVKGTKLFGVSSANEVYYAENYKSLHWTKLPGSLKSVSYDGTNLCGTSAADDIFCANVGVEMNPSWFQLNGKLKMISVGNNGDIVGVQANDNIFAGKLPAPAALPEPSWKQISGKLKQIQSSPDNKIVCGVNSNDDIFCAPTDTYTWYQLPGKLMQVTTAYTHIFGVNSNNDIYYSSNQNGQVNFVQINGKLKQISFDGQLLCGTTSADEVFCADLNLTSNPNWFQLPGALKEVVVKNGKLFGVSSDGQIFYSPSYKNAAWTQLPGSLKQIQYDGMTLCGTSFSDEIFCANKDLETAPKWYKINGLLKVVSVANNQLIGNNGIDDIFVGQLPAYPSVVPPPAPVTPPTPPAPVQAAPAAQPASGYSSAAVKY